jgi:hypothetical protein
MKNHPCCYRECPEPGTIHIGINGGDSHWICFRHLDRWNQNRARFLADGGGCEMQELGTAGGTWRCSTHELHQADVF